MQQPIKHYLFTKYDVGLYGSGGKKTRDWLKLRDKIFNEITFPSVQSQENKDFEWIVFFDSTSSSENFGKKGFTSFHTTEKTIRDDYKNIIDTNCIFTRLDNDDAILPNFMKLVRNIYDVAQPHGPMAVNIPYGYCCDYNTKKIFKLRPEFSNPFISKANLKEHRVYGHGEIYRYMPLVQLLECGPSWIRIIHDKNITNRLTGEKTNLMLKDVLRKDI